MQRQQRDVVGALLDRHGHTFADQAGIRLAQRPGPLYQLLVLSTLLGARISAEVGVGGARQLFKSGYRTPQAMRDATWHDRVEALSRGHYRRNLMRTATMLGDGAELCLRRWHGDLRELRAEAHGNLSRLRSLLTEFPGVGPTTVDIFVREVQGLWTEYEPFLDRKVRAGASRLRLPSSPAALAGLVAVTDLPRLASALVRVDLEGQSREQLFAPVSS
jgi:hypothetical protein